MRLIGYDSGTGATDGPPAVSLPCAAFRSPITHSMSSMREYSCADRAAAKLSPANLVISFTSGRDMHAAREAL